RAFARSGTTGDSAFWPFHSTAHPRDSLSPLSSASVIASNAPKPFPAALGFPSATTSLAPALSCSLPIPPQPLRAPDSTASASYPTKTHSPTSGADDPFVCVPEPAARRSLIANLALPVQIVDLLNDPV